MSYCYNAIINLKRMKEDILFENSFSFQII